DMTHHVCCKHCVSLAVLRHDPVCELLVEEFANRRDAVTRRHGRDVLGRLDAEMAHPAVLEMPQHDAVVAAELDSGRMLAALKILLRDSVGELLEVALHIARRA